MTEEKEYKAFVEAVEQEVQVQFKIPAENIRFEPGKEGKRDRILIETMYENGLKGVMGIEAAGLFLLYKRGNSLKNLVAEIAKDREKKCTRETVDILGNMENYEALKERMIVRAVNYRANREQIDNAIYRRFGDVALVVYLVLRESEYDFLSAKVQKKMLETWQQKEKDVFEAAMVNTHVLYPPRIYDWLECKNGKFAYQDGIFMNPLVPVTLQRGLRGNCLTNVKQLNGATALFYPGVAKRIAGLLGEDFYVAFTSIHEAMIHAASSADVEIIKESLSSVNENNEEEEILSNQVYYYSRGNNTLEPVWL